MSDAPGGAEAPYPDSHDILQFGPFAFETSKSRLCRDGVEVHLTPKAAAVLCYLLQRPGELITKEEFLEVVWEGVCVREESLTQAISVIRRAIGDSALSSEFIQTISGEGYRFIGTVTANGNGRSATPSPAIAAVPRARSLGTIQFPRVGVSNAGVRLREADESSVVHPTTASVQPARLPWVIAALSVVVAAAAIAVAVWAWTTNRAPTPAGGAPMRFSINLPPEAPLAPPASFFQGAGRPPLVLAPDASSLVYVASVHGQRQLYRHEMSSGEARPITGTEGAQDPFFSPDGRSVGFFANGKLKVVALAGGEPRGIAEAPFGHGGAWGENGYIYFVADELGGILRVAPTGDAPPRAITTLDVGSAGHVTPSLAPGHDLLLFTSRYFPPRVMTTATSGSMEPIELFAGSGARYVPTGHLLWIRNGQWVGAPFDVAKRELTGDPVVLMDDVRRKGWAGTAHVTWSDDGTLLYAPGTDLRAGRLVWRDPVSGEVEPLGQEPASYNAFFLSPDGSKLAYTLIDGSDSSVWLYDFERRNPEPLTRGPSDRVVGWMPDGGAVLYTSRRPDGGALYRVGLAASDRDPVELIGEAVPNGMATSQGLVYQNGAQDIVFAPFGEGGRTVELRDSLPIRATADLEAFPAVSPDGNWLAYMSDETGDFEIWVIDFPEASAPVRVSLNGGDEPRWSPDGSEIIYLQGTRLLSRSFSADSKVVLGPERVLFEGPYLNVGGYSWDVARHGNGQRFLLIENPNTSYALTRLEGMTNFFTWLQEKIPAGKREAP